MTNIQKPPVYKHILPRVMETTTNKYNNHDTNIATKLSLSPSSSNANKPVRDMSSDINREERQIRVDRILEKYRRQPSSSSVSREFSRSISCNATTEPLTESNFLHTVKTAGAFTNDDNNKNSGSRSISSYALLDRSNLSSTMPGMGQELKTNATNSLLPKSYSLKSLSEYRYRTLNKPFTVDHNSLFKSNVTHVNYDEDPLSSASSTTSSTNTAINTKILTPKADDNYYCNYSALFDWTVGNCCEETVSDRIKRRSYYVKFK
jgi:hypothetical protein